VEKVCRDCGETKPTTEFFKATGYKDGLAIRCKPCYMTQQARYKMRPPRAQTPEGMKRCTLCKLTQPVEAFTKNKGHHDGLDRACKTCCAARNAAYGRANRERLNGKQRERYAGDTERYADYDLKRRFGFSMGEYNLMIKAQGGVCAICANNDPGSRTKRFHVDHCHDSGRIRGLLCQSCNNGIGRFRDKPDLLRLAAEYLERITK
jgi:hypothetical protein